MHCQVHHLQFHPEELVYPDCEEAAQFVFHDIAGFAVDARHRPSTKSNYADYFCGLNQHD